MNKYCIVFFMLVAISCSGKKEILEFDMSEASHRLQVFNADDYFADISVVRLEAPSGESLLGDISRFHFYGDTVIFVNMDRLLAFDRRTGKYIGRIGHVGKGCDEYFNAYRTVFLRDFIYVDSQAEEFRVFDTGGNFVKSLRAETSLNSESNTALLFWLLPERIHTIGNNFLAYYCNRRGDETRLLAEFGPDGSLLYIIPNRNIFSRASAMEIGGFAQLYKYKDAVRFFEQPNDTLYSVSNGQLVPYCILKRHENDKNTYVDPLKNRKALEFYHLHEYDRYLMMLAPLNNEDDDEFRYYICDKITGGVSCYDSKRMGKFVRAVFENSLLDQFSGELVAFLYPHQYLDAVAGGDLPESLGGYADGLSEDDNPILVKIKLK